MSALRPVLTYGVACLHIYQNVTDLLEKCQTKLLKSVFSLKTFCRNTPLLQAMNVKRISQTVSANQKYILKSFMSSTKQKRLKFYSDILANDFKSNENLMGITILYGTLILK